MYQNLLKEGNGHHKFLRCPDLRDNDFEVLHSEITLDKVDLEFAQTIKYKPTANDSYFITYSNIINFSSKWLDTSGYLITQCKIGKITGYHMVLKHWEEPKIDQG